jgi:AAA family ATP:ADP antiporter
MTPAAPAGVKRAPSHLTRRLGGRWTPRSGLLDVRPGERRVTLAAFLALFGGLAAHTLLETGRDALFLTRLPASELPSMYLALAALALLFTRSRAGRLVTGRSLPTLYAVCAGGTLLFSVVGFGGPWALRALYVWTGLVATLTPMAFWLLLGEIYTIAQARRLYGPIGLGSQLGAIAGAAVARGMLGWLDPGHLLVASGLVLLLTALGPARLVSASARALHQDAPVGASPAPLAPRAVRRNAYLARVAALVLLSTVTFTLGDYVFKSAVARTVEPAELGRFFASFYMGLNALSVVAQIFVSGWLMRVLGLSRALAVLPLLVMMGAVGVAAGAGLAGAVLLKIADGALRPSLNRVGVELLYVPVPDERRAAAKPTIDALGGRGGQALASVLILALTAWGGGSEVVAGAAALACLLWAAVALALQPHYLNVFRAALRKGMLLDGAALPALDLSSLEALFAALNSRDDAEVVAALEILADQGRARVLPALLLHHPSKPVVLRTLTLLSGAGRDDWIPIADRLLQREDPEIRAAALRALTTAQPDERLLRRASEDASPLVRATAFVGLIGSGSHLEEAWRGLRELTASASLATRVALAEAIEGQPAPAFERVLVDLAHPSNAQLAVHVARAMAKVRSPAFLPALIRWLSVREVREAAREALLEHGDEALAELDAALGDPRTPARVREHIPRTISLFPPAQAIPTLQRHLAAERDGRVRFKILRGLGRIATDHPEVELDGALVREMAARTVGAVVEALRFRVSLAKGAERVPARATPAHTLLVTLLRDKELRRIERFFRLLQLRFRSENVRAIHRGLGNADRRVRAASRELLENLLEEPLRATVMALVDDLPDEQRLARIPGERPVDDDYGALLTLMTVAGSASLRWLAAFHAAEIGLHAASVTDPFGNPGHSHGR